MPLLTLSTGLLGLLVGALLAEAFLLVPYWRTLPAPVFFELHKDYGPRLYRFFAPLTIAGTLLPAVSAVAAILSSTATLPVVLAGALSLAMVAIYGVYFKSANASFAQGRLTPAELSEELARWHRWHSVRLIIGLAAFALSLIALHG